MFPGKRFTCLSFTMSFPTILNHLDIGHPLPFSSDKPCKREYRYEYQATQIRAAFNRATVLVFNGLIEAKPFLSYWNEDSYLTRE